MNNLDRIKSLRAQDYGVAGLSTTDVDWLIAEVERLQIAADFERESAKDANAQLNAMRADRDRYKAWHDAVNKKKTMALHTDGPYGGALWFPHCTPDKPVRELISRPQPLKENE